MRDNNNNQGDISAALAQLDEEDAEALAEMIDESPELLQQMLVEYGYKTEDSDVFLTNSDSTGLTEAQCALADALEGELSEPKSVDAIVEIVGDEDSAFRQQYSSAQYRSWVSEQLKKLADAGEIGRFREGRSVYYTATPEQAVRHWARVNERFAGNLSVTDASTIAEETKMPVRVIRDAIRSLTHD